MGIREPHILRGRPRSRPQPAALACLLAAGLLLATTAVTGGEDNPSLIPESVREAASARVAAGHYRSVIIGVSEGEETTWASFGRVSDNGPAPSPDTVFEIGSLTKPLTAALLALAAESGELSLDDRVGSLAGEDSRLDPRLREEVRLWHLATHLSGLPNTPDDLQPDDPSRLFESYSPQDLADFLANHPLAAPPEQGFTYSNLGYALLGRLMGNHFGADYGRSLREHVTGPLGLDDVVLATDRDAMDRLAPGFDYDLNPAPAWSLPAFQPAGSLKSSARDLLRWVDLNRTPPDDTLGRALDRLSRREVSLGDNGNAMALGWKLDEQDGRRIAWHTGRTAGHAGFAGFDREKERSVVVLANTGNSLETLGFATLAPERDIPPVRDYQPLPDHVGALYAGRYRMSPGYVVTVREKDNGLFVQAPGRPGLRLYSIDGERFFTRGVDSEVHFIEGPDGSIQQLRIVTDDDVRQVGHRMGATESRASRQIDPRPPRELKRHAGVYRMGSELAFEIVADRDRLLISNGDGVARPVYPAPDGRFFHRSQPLELLFTEGEGPDSPKRLILFRNGFRIEADRVEDGAGGAR